MKHRHRLHLKHPPRGATFHLSTVAAYGTYKRPERIAGVLVEAMTLPGNCAHDGPIAIPGESAVLGKCYWTCVFPEVPNGSYFLVVFDPEDPCERATSWVTIAAPHPHHAPHGGRRAVSIMWPPQGSTTKTGPCFSACGSTDQAALTSATVTCGGQPNLPIDVTGEPPDGQSGNWALSINMPASYPVYDQNNNPIVYTLTVVDTAGAGASAACRFTIDSMPDVGPPPPG